MLPVSFQADASAGFPGMDAGFAAPAGPDSRFSSIMSSLAGGGSQDAAQAAASARAASQALPSPSPAAPARMAPAPASPAKDRPSPADASRTPVSKPQPQAPPSGAAPARPGKSQASAPATQAAASDGSRGTSQTQDTAKAPSDGKAAPASTGTDASKSGTGAKDASGATQAPGTPSIPDPANIAGTEAVAAFILNGGTPPPVQDGASTAAGSAVQASGDPQAAPQDPAAASAPQASAPAQDPAQTAATAQAAIPFTLPQPGPATPQGAQAPADASTQAAMATSQAATAQAGPPPGQASQAAAKGGISQAQARKALDQLVPGATVQSTVAKGDGTPEKPALTEFLNVPKPTVETPSILAAGDPATGKGAPDAAAPALAGQAQALLVQGAAAAGSQGGPAALAGPATAPKEPAQGIPGAEAAQVAAAPGASSAVRVSAPASSGGAGTPTPQSSPGGQVDATVKWMLKSQSQSAEIQLKPESLGSLQIRLQVEGNQVHARIVASDPSALPLLQDHRAALESSLREQGLNLGSFDLSQGNPGHQAAQQQDAQGSAGSSLASAQIQAASEVGQDSPTLDPASLSNPHRVEMLA